MKLFLNRSMTTKLILTFSFMLVLMVGMGFASLAAMASINDNNQALNEKQKGPQTAETAKTIQQTEESNAESYRTTRFVLLGFVGCGGLVGLGLSLWVARVVSRPLKQCKRVLDAVAKGDLTHQADASTRDEVGQVAGALNSAIEHMRITNEKSLDVARQLEAISGMQAVIEFKPDGTVVSANENFLKVFGYSTAEIVGRHHSLFVDPAAAALADYREFWTRLGRGDNQSGEFKRIAKGGREIWIRGGYYPITDAAGKVTKVVKFASEITADKTTQMDAARTQSMLDTAPINVMFADKEFKIRYANAATIKTLRSLEHLLPIKADQLVGQSIDIFHKRPEHQRRMLSDPSNLPHSAQIQVGPRRWN